MAHKHDWYLFLILGLSTNTSHFAFFTHYNGRSGSVLHTGHGKTAPQAVICLELQYLAIWRRGREEPKGRRDGLEGRFCACLEKK
jgi:hypothetical protein